MAGSVLFLGGSGTISAACVAEAVGLGFNVTVLNRDASRRPLPEGVETLVADLDDTAALAAAVAGREFDSVADFLTFTPQRLQRNLEVLEGRVGQYVFISSASAYAKPAPSLPIRESTPLRNPFWQYSRDKIACEDLLVARYREDGFPATIVRPSHTYDRFSIPLEGGWTQLARAMRGGPLVVHGDGTSLWTLTHASDFAYSFAGLLCHPATLGESYHITGDEALTWDAIATALARAAGVARPTIVHVASEAIAKLAPEFGPGLLGDKAHSTVFDNTKVRALRPGFAQRVPFRVGAEQIVAAHLADNSLRRVDEALEATLDRLLEYAALAG